MNKGEEFLKLVIDRWDSVQIDFTCGGGCNHNGLVGLT